MIVVILGSNSVYKEVAILIQMKKLKVKVSRNLNKGE